MRNTLALIVASLVVVACGGDVHGGFGYKNDLANLIRQSDRIVATEHSDEFDLFDVEKEKSQIEGQIVYGEREFSTQQRAYFLATIESLDPETQDAFLRVFLPSTTPFASIQVER